MELKLIVSDKSILFRMEIFGKYDSHGLINVGYIQLIVTVNELMNQRHDTDWVKKWSRKSFKIENFSQVIGLRIIEYFRTTFAFHFILLATYHFHRCTSV